MISIMLVLCEQERLIRTVPVRRLPLTIGRGPRCDVRLDHPAVSRLHARLEETEGRPLLVDAGSSNGLLVNGRGGRRFELATGDRLAIGPFTVHFEIGAGAADDSGPRRALETLLDLASRHDRPIEPAELLGVMLDRLMEVLEAERGFVLARRGESLDPVLARRFDGGALSTSISRSVAGEVARSGRPVLLHDLAAQNEQPITPSLQQEGIRSVVCAPVIVGNRVEGVLYLDSTLATRRFGADDLELLTTMARQSGRVLEAHAAVGRLNRDVVRLRELARDGWTLDAIPATDGPMRTLLDRARRAAARDVPVLILGESGTGKEVLARAIHAASSRRDAPFVPVHCAALAAGLVESELFGHEKGAFTGATERRTGRIALADGGTLFLDEVGEIPSAVQVKLLRVLEEREVEPVGSSRPVKIDVRLLAATRVDLAAAVQSGAFREDLYWRLDVLSLTLPPLRERAESIAPLALRFVSELAPRMGSSVTGIDETALAALMAYPWPGNVRELRNVIERALVFERSGRVTNESLPSEFGAVPGPGAGGAGGPLERARSGLERVLIEKALRDNGGNVSKAAAALGLHRMSLQRRLEALGIDAEGFAAAGDEEERRRVLEALRACGGDANAAAARLGISRATMYRRLRALGLTGQEPERRR